MFRKPTFFQLVFQGPAAFIADKNIRRCVVTTLYLHDALLLYRAYKDSK